MRLLAFSVVVLAGAMLMGIGSLSRNNASRGTSQGTGGFLLVVGSVFMVAELLASGFFKEVLSAFRPREGPRTERAGPSRPSQPGWAIAWRSHGDGQGPPDS